MGIDESHFAVRVYESSRRIDLKGSVKNEIVDALENKFVLRESIGNILAVFAPLHVPLSDIDSAQMDEKGKITIKLPLHRDVIIQLKPENAKKLVDKLNQLRALQERKRKHVSRSLTNRTLKELKMFNVNMTRRHCRISPLVPNSLRHHLMESEEKSRKAGRETLTYQRKPLID